MEVYGNKTSEGIWWGNLETKTRNIGIVHMGNWYLIELQDYEARLSIMGRRVERLLEDLELILVIGTER